MSDDTERDNFLATARKRFAAAAEDEKHLRDKFVSDLRFASPDGEDQWDARVKQQREAAQRPVMAFPRCHTFVQQVSNEARQNKPQIKFSPRLDADKDTAEVYEGLARYIQYASSAQVAYETAVEYSAGASFGYYRFLTDYCDDESDDLDLKVVPVLDPLTIYGILVPACFDRKPRFAFVVEDVPKDEYKAIYPDSEMASLSWAEAGAREGWVGSDSVRIAEYWYTEEAKGKGGRKGKTTVKFCKTNGMEILPDSETVWPGSTIPIIPVLGKQMIQEGKPRLFSVVRSQIDAQKMLNYAKTRIAETLAQAPVTPFMVVEGQISGYEDQWATINTTPRPVVTYKAIDVAGRPAPAPQRQVYEPPIQALSTFVMQEIDDMKATTGIFDASLGQQGNEVSGKAIFQRQQQTNLSIMHFMDNLERSFKQGGDVIAELIPLIYDSAREIEILGADEASKVVKINQPHTDPATGKPVHHDMTKGKYSLVVTMGRSFSSKRQESFDMITGVLQTSPNMLPMVGDILFNNADVAGADQMAERFKKMLPPQLQTDENNPIPPEAQAHIAQAQQQMQQMQGEMQKLMFEKQGKVVEHQGKMQQIQAQNQADLVLEKMKLENALAIAEVETKAQSTQERMAAVEDMMRQFHDQAHDVAMQAQQHQHAQQLAAQQAQQQAALADQGAQNQSAQSAQDAAQSQAAQAAAPQGE